MKKNIIIFGASGFIGGEVIKYFLKKNSYRVIAVKRKKEIEPLKTLKVVGWESPDMLEELINADVIINFSGANIAEKFWSEKRKKILRDSRVLTTKKIVDVLNGVSEKPKNGRPLPVFINASAIGYYGIAGQTSSGNESPKTEDSPKGRGFLSDLCDEWEKAGGRSYNGIAVSDALPANSHAGRHAMSRNVFLRLGLVLGAGGGVLPALVNSVKWFLGAIVGSGSQIVSWIGVEEIPRVIEFVIDNERLTCSLYYS